MSRWWRVAAAALLLPTGPAVLAQTASRGTTIPAVAPAPRLWSLRLPAIDKVAFRGSLTQDKAGLGAGAPMLYPAAPPAIFFVAVLAHGLASSAAQDRQRASMQADADKVLLPLEPVLGPFTHRRLMGDAMRQGAWGADARLLEPAEPAGERWTIEAAPIFSMTQDGRAIVLDNAVRIFAPGGSAARYTQTVRVVSAPLAVPEPAVPADASAAVALWLEADGRRVLDTSAALLAESIDVAIDDLDAAAAPAALPSARTFRYPEGGQERIERAQLVRERCGRLLIRSLRGWLLSVPAAGENAPGCTASR